MTSDEAGGDLWRSEGDGESSPFGHEHAEERPIEGTLFGVEVGEDGERSTHQCDRVAAEFLNLAMGELSAKERDLRSAGAYHGPAKARASLHLREPYNPLLDGRRARL